MKTVKMALIAAAVLAPALSFAGGPRPYVLVNGRSQSSGRASRGAPSAGSRPPAFSTHFAAPAAFVSGPSRRGAYGSAYAPRTSGDFLRPALRGSSASFHSFNSFWPARGVSRADAPTGGDAPTPPPYYSKPGALIRTAGQLPVYTPTGDARTFTVEAGAIQLDNRWSRSLGGPGVTWGSPSQDSSSGMSGNGATSNDPASRAAF